MKYDFGVLIGRFQPFHIIHQILAAKALEKSEKLIIVLGSHRSAPNIRNPWTVAEREQMIRASLPDVDPSRLHFVAVRDYLYNDMVWLTEVQQKVREVTRECNRIALFGSRTDYTSYYLEFFYDMWTPELETGLAGIHSTQIRNIYFDRDSKEDFHRSLPGGVVEFLEGWRGSAEYERLSDELAFVRDYKKQTQVGPHPVQFITCDAVVTCSGHVLIARRKGQPGKGLLALPGGFVEPTERIENAVLRELKEETRIALNKSVLRSRIVAREVFDHPDRSSRGRTVTHAFHIKLDENKLPAVKADTDVEDVFWMPLSDIFFRENEFYEDHVSIISHFVLGR